MGAIKEVIELLHLSMQHGNNLRKPLEHLFVSGEFSDFNIKIREKEFKVHRNILGSQSSVFNAVFTNGSTDSLPNVNKFSERDFEDFLRWLYIKEFAQCADEKKLLELAVEFDVLKLKSTCEEKILKRLDDNNALEVYLLGHSHSSEMIKRPAFNRMKARFSDIDENFYDEPKMVTTLVKLMVELKKICQTCE